MSNVTNTDPVVTESKLTEFYNDIKPFLGCPAYVTQEGDEMYYSTEEKVVGRWVDGKPLYVKTISCGNLSGSTTTQTIAHNITNFEKCVHIAGIMRHNSANVFETLPTIENGSSLQRVQVDATYIYINQWGTWASWVDCYMTIYYTKTTDSAVTTIETKPTHYSTDEQVVGTWIDSKPIYQKTLVLSASEWVKYNKKYTIALSSKIPNIKEVVEFNGFVKVSYASQVLTYGFGTTDTSSTGELSIITNCSQGNLCLTDLLGITMVDGSIVTLRYTKATD